MYDLTEQILSNARKTSVYKAIQIRVVHVNKENAEIFGVKVHDPHCISLRIIED